MNNLFRFTSLFQSLLLAVALSSCSQIAHVQAPISSTPSDTISLPSLPQSSSALVQAVLETPDVARSFAVAIAAQSQVAIATTARATKVGLTGSTGLTGENNRSTIGTATATITANKPLYDNGQTDKSILLSALAAQSASLEAKIVADSALQKVIDTYGTLATAKQTVKIIDHYLELYNAREDLVKSAVQASVLSNSDYLELRSLKNQTLSERAKSGLAIQRSESSLKNTLGLNYAAAMSELAEKYGQLKTPKFSAKLPVQKELIDLRAAQLNTQIEIQAAKNTPTANLQTSISETRSRNTGTSVFAGVVITLPIRDGGEAAARIAYLSKELKILEQDLGILDQNILQARENWESFGSYYQTQKKLLLEQKSISSERIAESELLLNAGRSSIKELAKEILASAQTEIALIQLKSEYLSQSLTATAVTSQTCELFYLCELIQIGIAENQ